MKTRCPRPLDERDRIRCVLYGIKKDYQSQIICYEILKASSDDSKREWRDYPEVNSDQLQRLIDHFIETAVDIDVIDPNNPKKIISRIKRMFTRLQPDEMEASFMRGFLSGIKKKIK